MSDGKSKNLQIGRIKSKYSFLSLGYFRLYASSSLTMSDSSKSPMEISRIVDGDCKFLTLCFEPLLMKITSFSYRMLLLSSSSTEIEPFRTFHHSSLL